MSLVIGTQLYGWGQVYGMRGQDIADHYDEVLGAIGAMGMDTAEAFIGAWDEAGLRAWASMLRAHGLRPASMYTGGAVHSEDEAKATHKTLLKSAPALASEGFTVLSMNPDPIGREKTDAELATQASALEQLGGALKEAGVALALHNHTPEMLSESREFHNNLRKTDPSLVGLCLDFHWCWRGGADPYAIYEEYKDRVFTLHLRQSRDGIWTEALEDGDIDYRPLIDDLVASGFAGPVIVELALEDGTPETRDVVENNRVSLEYLRSLM